ncbi:MULTISPECIES: hypothetical protein [Streptomyces]|uniref:hypothetical protein n=1 Tax=Streptomyces TaxID=1883 RepID=UPI001872E1F9|nr:MULTISPECIES: hypothetical protein [Streptomyces]
MPRESGEHGTISPRAPRPLHLPAQHSDLMAKHEDLGIVRGSRSAQQEQPAQQSAEDQVEQTQTHKH